MEQDRLLLVELSNKEEGAFNKLYDTYWECLFFYVVRIIENEQDAEDIIQEVFMTIWNVKGDLMHIRCLKAYLIVIAKNKALKYIVEHKNKQAYLDSLAQFVWENEVPIEQAFITTELSALIDTEISNLPPKMQEVFILSRKEYLSHSEIAKKLEISDQTVKKHISKALKFLRLKLEDYHLVIFILTFFLKK